MSSFCIITTTFSDHSSADALIDKLLEEKLAACIQKFPVQSSYIWKGKICDDDEIKVLIKTQTKYYEKIKAIIEAEHPYEVPELLLIPVENGSEKYLGWIEENLA